MSENEKEKLYYSKSGLKARGWTEAGIRDLLGDVEIKQVPRCKVGQSILRNFLGRRPESPNYYFNYQYYYEVAKVEAIEKTKAFKERKRTRAKA